MKWFKRMLARWVNEVNEINIVEDSMAPISLSGAKKRHSINSIQGNALDSDAQLNFTVYSAIGGKVVEFRRYDRKTDRSDHQVYVIGKDEDFGAKIAKIAMFEVMKD